MNQLQEDHCEKLYKNYHMLLKFVKEIQHEGCSLIAGIDCQACRALDVLRKIGEE